MVSKGIGLIGHVMLVEHEATPRETTRHLLSRANFSVRALARASDAIGHLKNGERPAVILANSELPVIDGVTLLHIVNQRWGFIPVVLYGRSMTPTKRARIIAGGADACFDQPLDMPRVIEFLKERMGMQDSQQSA